jgi:hypothetical protein
MRDSSDTVLLTLHQHDATRPSAITESGDIQNFPKQWCQRQGPSTEYRKRQRVSYSNFQRSPIPDRTRTWKERGVHKFVHRTILGARVYSRSNIPYPSSPFVRSFMKMSMSSFIEWNQRRRGTYMGRASCSRQGSRKSHVETDRLHFACTQSAAEKFGYNVSIHPSILSSSDHPTRLP